MHEEKEGRRHAAGHVFALIGVMFFGSIVVSTKLLLKTMKPLDILFWRFLFGYIFLWLAKPAVMHVKEKKDELLFALCGLCGVSIYFFLQNSALRLTRSADVSVIICIAPIVTAIMSMAVKRTRPEKGFFPGTVIALAGVLLVCSDGAGGKTGFLGDLLVFLATVSWGVYSLVCEKIAQKGYDGTGVIRRCFMYGLLSMVPFLPHLSSPALLMNPKILSHLSYMGFGGSGLAYLLWDKSARRIGTVNTNVYLYLIPVVTIFVSVIFEGTHLTAKIIIGCLLTITGSLISEGFFRKRTAP